MTQSTLPTEEALYEVLQALMGWTEREVTPDAYAMMVKMANSVVLRVYERASHRPHLSEVGDLGTAVGILAAGRRQAAALALTFLWEALAFREDQHVRPMPPSWPVPTLQVLIDTLYGSSQPYSARYAPPERGSFDAYQTYYSHLTLAEVLNDMTHFGDVVALNRMLAIFERAVTLACQDAAVSPDDRWRAAKVSGVAEDCIRTNHAPDIVARFDAAAGATIRDLEADCRYPDMV